MRDGVCYEYTNNDVKLIEEASKEVEMQVFEKYLAGIDNPNHREKTEKILAWVANIFPNIEPQIKWNQSMFTDHGTFIIGFSTAKHYFECFPRRSCYHAFC
jgi:uncharacterized protein YdhG (YjbR/CyaY superfamily)